MGTFVAIKPLRDDVGKAGLTASRRFQRNSANLTWTCGDSLTLLHGDERETATKQGRAVASGLVLRDLEAAQFGNAVHQPRRGIEFAVHRLRDHLRGFQQLLGRRVAV